MIKDKVTIRELGKMLGLSENVMRTHLCCFEKYRIPFSTKKLLTYRYNYAFLLDLRDFYIEKSQSLGKRYEHYKKIVEKLNKIINLWQKKIRTNNCQP